MDNDWVYIVCIAILMTVAILMTIALIAQENRRRTAETQRDDWKHASLVNRMVRTSALHPDAPAEWDIVVDGWVYRVVRVGTEDEIYNDPDADRFM